MSFLTLTRDFITKPVLSASFAIRHFLLLVIPCIPKVPKCKILILIHNSNHLDTLHLNTMNPFVTKIKAE